ncbi:MAG TPA: hypothetical protein VGB17_04745 [Pyrinomonadaceae bacterium]|jgi:hypothetical protein
MSESQSLATLDTWLEPLLEVAGPDLYRNNAFRIIGVPVTATDREIRRQLDKIEMTKKLGGNAPQGLGPLPLEPAPEDDAIREAMQLLRDPEHRLIDEFFWFWTSKETPGNGALEALAQKDVRTAVERWTTQANQHRDGGMAVHNLAIVSHLMALDMERAALKGTLSSEQQEQRNRYWREALERWGDVLDHEGIWLLLAKRVRELDDPRLTTAVARLLRTTLPLALLSINAQLARQAAERGQEQEAKRHLQLIEQSGFDQPSIDEALRRAAIPLRERLKSLCQSAEASVAEVPERGVEAASRLLDEASPLVQALDQLLPSGNTLRDDASDELALTALQCGINYGNKTEEWKAPQEIFLRLRPLAVSTSVQQRVDFNLNIAKTNIEDLVYVKCWFCNDQEMESDAAAIVKMYGNVQRTWIGSGTRVTWESLTLKVPRCPRCKGVHDRTSNLEMTGGCLGGVVGLIICAFIFLYIGVFWEALAWPTILGSLFVLISLAGIGFSIASSMATISSPKGIEGETHKNQFITIKERLAQGWKIGEKPS